MIVVYMFGSCPFCQRVTRFLDEHEIPYRIETIDPWDRARVVELSGQSGVPIIVDESRDDEVVVDSAVIVQYLERHHVSAG